MVAHTSNIEVKSKNYPFRLRRFAPKTILSDFLSASQSSRLRWRGFELNRKINEKTDDLTAALLFNCQNPDRIY